MLELAALLKLAKSTATRAGQRLLDSLTPDHKHYVHCRDNPKEIKALADTVLEEDVLRSLASAGLAILSEESGYLPAQQQSPYWFIVDPLDGTFNFVKGLGPSAVSIAVWDDHQPVFGVIYSCMDRQLVWGGAGLGSWADGVRISTSDTANQSEASICTGFPSRFDFGSDHAQQEFWSSVRRFGKVRMIGSAAISLLHVARGSADAYAEEDIMLWDVAAGLAIVEGAGGAFSLTKSDHQWSYRVHASNAPLAVQLAAHA